MDPAGVMVLIPGGHVVIDEFVPHDLLNDDVEVGFGYGGGKYSVEGKAGGCYYGYGSGSAPGTCTPWYTGDGFGSGIGSGSGHGCGDGAGDSDGYGTGYCSGGH